MITGRDFVVLSDQWDGLPTSTIHLFSRISRKNRVFWLNTVNRMPRPTWTDAKKVMHVLRGWCRKSGDSNREQKRDTGSSRSGVRVATPAIVPWFKPVIRRLNCASMLRCYRRLSREHEIRHPIVVTTFPSAVDFVKSVDAPLKVYYCVDQWLDYPGLDVTAGRKMEDELLDHVDAVVATSRELESKCRPGCASLYLPHGVDFEHFRRGHGDSGPLPELQDLPRPIVGFFGLISEWVDLDVIRSLSRAFPHVSFVLIGKSEADTRSLANCPNVHLLGRVAYDDLPRYASRFDVGLIPFVTNKLTKAVNPLKLMEYYALGLPVLATRLPELERAEGPITLASTESEFCRGLRAIFENGTKQEAAEDAVQAARRNTWDQRVERFSEFLDNPSVDLSYPKCQLVGA